MMTTVSSETEPPPNKFANSFDHQECASLFQKTLFWNGLIDIDEFHGEAKF